MSRRHFRIYFKRGNNCVGAGIEEYEQSDWRPEVKAFASVFINERLANSEIITLLLDEYCNQNEPAVVKLTQIVDREAMSSLRQQYPNIVFRRTRSKEVTDLRLLTGDALSRKSTIFERL